MAYHSRDQRGVSVIEVLIALGMAGIIIASVGNALLAVKRIGIESANKEKAVAYAQQALEVVNEQRTSLFLPCNGTPGVCTSGAQSCTIQSGYTFCWLPFSGNVPAVLPAVDPLYTRTVTAEDWTRGDTGIADTNVKKIVSTVTWIERGQAKNVSLTSVLTAWKGI